MRAPAIRFEPDGYLPTAARPVGRQMAGHGFLRAAVNASEGTPLVGYGPAGLEGKWRSAVHDLGAKLDPLWIVLDQAERLAAYGVCFRPDPQLGADARLRLRIGPAAYSVCGQVHTISSNLGQIGGLLSDPLMEWDALICPSGAVAQAIREVLEVEADYLHWKFGPNARILWPQLPIIPLGVHTADFDLEPTERARARSVLGIGENEVVALYTGRRSIFTKAHPLPMYLGLEAAVRQTGLAVTLIECGYPSPSGMANALDSAPALHCPSVRSLIVDGREPRTRSQCLAAADFFISLSDNVQETFGLTPVEAMAAGLPVVITDWNGYRETVRDGIDGFRIATWMPQAGTGDDLARAREAGTLPMDVAHYATASFTSVDMAQLRECLVELIQNHDRRRSMGWAARVRAVRDFDWRSVFLRYQSLWHELDERRTSAQAPVAPRITGGGLDFFAAFADYPSATIGPETIAELEPGVSLAGYASVSSSPLFPLSPAPEQMVSRLWPALATGPITISQVAAQTACEVAPAVRVIAALAKMGIVRLRNPKGGEAAPRSHPVS